MRAYLRYLRWSFLAASCAFGTLFGGACTVHTRDAFVLGTRNFFQVVVPSAIPGLIDYDALVAAILGTGAF